MAFYLTHVLTLDLAFYLTCILTLFVDFFSGAYADILSDINSDILSGIFSDILSGILSGTSSEILCGQGPAAITLILSLLFASGGGYCDHEHAVEVRRGQELSVRVQRGCS